MDVNILMFALLGRVGGIIRCKNPIPRMILDLCSLYGKLF